MFCQKVFNRILSSVTTGLMVGVVPMAAPYELIHLPLMSGALAQGMEVSGSQYVVYLSGATAANLRRAKTAVPDAFINTLDNGTRVVQLGRFNNLNLAQRRLSELQSKGLAPQIYTQSGAVTASAVPVAPTPPRTTTTRTSRSTTVPSNVPAVPSAFIADTPAALPQNNGADATANNTANPFNVPVPPSASGNGATGNSVSNSQTNTVRGSGVTINRNTNVAATGDNQGIPLPNVPRPVNTNQPMTTATAQPIPIERTAVPTASGNGTSPTSIEIVRPSSTGSAVPPAVAMNPAPVNTPPNRYFVIIPNGSLADLQRVRNFSPNAQIKSSGRGTYIEIQGYPDRLSAETMNSTMLKQRFDSRVVYF